MFFIGIFDRFPVDIAASDFHYQLVKGGGTDGELPVSFSLLVPDYDFSGAVGLGA